MGEIILDTLTQESVNIKTNTNGLMHRKSYINSIRGRQEIVDELPIDIQNDIFFVWGNVATIEEPIYIEPEPTIPQMTDTERIAGLEITIMGLMDMVMFPM